MTTEFTDRSWRRIVVCGVWFVSWMQSMLIQRTDWLARRDTHFPYRVTMSRVAAECETISSAGLPSESRLCKQFVKPRRQ